MPLLILIAIALTVARLFVPTVGHAWPTVFMAAAHIYVGVVATLLWLRRGRWRLGWVYLLVPSLLEAVMFFACAPAHAQEALPRPRPAVAAQSRFTGKFELVPLFDSGHRPVVVNGHTYYGERNRISFRTDAGDVVTVFAGATTDGASIPRPVWPLLPPDGPYY